MADEDGLVLSVRAEARRTVDPDAAVLSVVVSARRDSKTAALSAVAAALDRLTADLGDLGGVALTASSRRAALTWSAASATTNAEREHDPETGRFEPTGWVTASVSVGRSTSRRSTPFLRS